jgi:hypothetical protein
VDCLKSEFEFVHDVIGVNGEVFLPQQQSLRSCVARRAVVVGPGGGVIAAVAARLGTGEVARVRRVSYRKSLMHTRRGATTTAAAAREAALLPAQYTVLH